MLLLSGVAPYPAEGEVEGPVVGASIGEITPIFYQHMFGVRPNLERNLFNRGHQVQCGQQKTLADAIAAYATLLASEDAPNIDAMVNWISSGASWAVMTKPEPGHTDSRIPAGEVCNFTHDDIFEFDTLRCSQSSGYLVVEESDEPLLLVLAGIGCTPIIETLNRLVQAESTRPVTVLHSDQSMASHTHPREMAELVKQLPDACMHYW